MKGQQMKRRIFAIVTLALVVALSASALAATTYYCNKERSYRTTVTHTANCIVTIRDSTCGKIENGEDKGGRYNSHTCVNEHSGCGLGWVNSCPY